jgi:uncharacterized protein (DUF58 family)
MQHRVNVYKTFFVASLLQVYCVYCYACFLLEASAGQFRGTSALRVRWACLLLGLAFSITCATLLQTQAWAGAAAVGAAGVLGVVGPSLVIRCISCRIMTSGTVRRVAGETVTVTLSYRTLLGRFTPPVQMQINDAAVGNIVRVIHFKARRGEMNIDISQLPRGVYEITSISLATHWPLNLRVCQRRVACDVRLIVWPRPVQLVRLPILKTKQGSSLRAYIPAVRIGDDGDPMSVRPYRRGDTLRQIHWAQSARHDRLIVRERQANNPQTATVFIHTARDKYSHSDAFEQTLGMAAAMIHHWIQQAVAVQLCVGEQGVVSSTVLQPFMDTLARADLSLQTHSPASGSYSVILPDGAYGAAL